MDRVPNQMMMVAGADYRFEVFYNENHHEKKVNKQRTSQKEETKKSSSEIPIKLDLACRFCDEIFAKKSKLDRHLLKHTGEKPFICDVEGCSKGYSNSSHLNRHKKTSHEAKPEIASVTCKQPNCHQMFTNKSNMNRHYVTHHVNLLPHACSECSEKFRRKIQLKRHKIQKHTGEYAYTCQHCSKGFHNQFTFSRHLTTHKQGKPRSCPDCQLTFTKWSLLVEHRRKLHKSEARIACDLCGKTFYRKPNIKEHIQLHLKAATDEVFQCCYESCSKFYTAKRNLMAHVRSKHESKRWQCDLCNREMSTKQKLEQHINAHRDPKKAMKLVKVSTASKLVGVSLDQASEAKIISGEGSRVVIDSLPPPVVDSSCTDLSDF